MTYVKEVAIIALALLGTIAILKEINGTLLAAIASGISGIAGYEIGKKRGS